MKISQKDQKTPGKILDIGWDTRNPNKIIRAHEMGDRSFETNWISFGGMRIIFRKIW
jgi:hypothetical protein